MFKIACPFEELGAVGGSNASSDCRAFEDDVKGLLSKKQSLAAPHRDLVNFPPILMDPSPTVVGAVPRTSRRDALRLDL